MFKAYPTDLVPGEPLVCTATRNVCENLRTSDGVFQCATVCGSGRILPDWAALKSECRGSELVSETMLGIERREESFCVVRPVDGPVLLAMQVRICWCDGSKRAHLPISGDGHDLAKVDASNLHLLDDEVDGLKPHADR